MEVSSTLRWVKKNSELLYQIVLLMSNQFLDYALSRIVRCRPSFGHEGRQWRSPRVPPTGD
jgi:hypothetical protein